MSKLRIVLSSIGAFIAGLLGVVGLTGFCCTLTGAAILSFLGLASISTFLVYNNKWLFGLAVLFVVLAIYYYIKYKRNKTCKIYVEKDKN